MTYVLKATPYLWRYEGLYFARADFDCYHIEWTSNIDKAKTFNNKKEALNFICENSLVFDAFKIVDTLELNYNNAMREIGLW